MTLPLDVPGAPPTGLVVVGLDISQTATGICDGRRAWTIGEKGKHDASWVDRGARMRRTRARIVTAALDPGPALIVVETPLTLSQPNVDSHGLWWSVVNVLQTVGPPLAYVNLSTLKTYATGKGNAGKTAMVLALAKRIPAIDNPAGDDNMADAAWLAAMGYERVGNALCALPAVQSAALGRVDWPEVRLP